MKKTLSLALLVAGGIVGCDSPPSPTSPDGPTTSNSEARRIPGQDALAPQEELVATPNGYYHRSCVHEIPNGARENRDGTITEMGGAATELPECLYPGQRTAEGVRIRRSLTQGWRSQTPDNNGWIEWSQDGLSGGHTFSELSADWIVPDDPSSGYSGSTGPYYTFPGIWSNEYILQPVLQYGGNGLYGGNYWTLASWRCNVGTDCTYSTPLTASVGDTIHGVVSSSDCEDGECIWTVVTQNLTADTLTYRSWVDTVAFDTATGGAVEVYDISSCSQYPRFGVSYTDISLKDENAAAVTPSWGDSIRSGLNPSCSFSVTSSSSTTSLTHYVPFSAYMTGDDEIAPEEECGWQAWGSGGVPPYSYNWWGALSGSTQTIYGELSESSYLWVAITDSWSNTDTAQMFIDVDEMHECEWK